MVNQSSREIFYFKIPIFVSDLLIHLGVLLTLIHIMTPSDVNQVAEERVILGTMALLACSFTAAIGIAKIRLHERKINPARVIWRATYQTILTTLVFTIMMAMVYKIMPRHLIIYEFLCSATIISTWHYLANQLVRRFRKFGHNTRHVVIIGASENSISLYDELMYGQVMTGYVVDGFFSSLNNVQSPKDTSFLGKIDDFFTWIEGNNTDEIYCSLPPSKYQDIINRIIHICNDNFIDFFFVPNMDGYPKRKMNFSNFGKVTVIKLREEPLNSPWAKLLKRSTDVIFSLLILCSIYPCSVVLVWLGNILTGDMGPLFFKQKRTGYNGMEFWMYKFRSMKASATSDTLQATKDDPRKTRFGNFIRRTSIDELPQFINVLKGDMSIIGPRPHMEYHTEIYGSLISNYMVRHLAKPGITGWAQVNGCRGETKTTDEMIKRVEHDIWYIEHWSPLLDADIVLKTLWQLLPGHDKQAY